MVQCWCHQTRKEGGGGGGGRGRGGGESGEGAQGGGRASASARSGGGCRLTRARRGCRRDATEGRTATAAGEGRYDYDTTRGRTPREARPAAAWTRERRRRDAAAGRGHRGRDGAGPTPTLRPLTRREPEEAGLRVWSHHTPSTPGHRWRSNSGTLGVPRRRIRREHTKKESAAWEYERKNRREGRGVQRSDAREKLKRQTDDEEVAGTSTLKTTTEPTSSPILWSWLFCHNTTLRNCHGPSNRTGN